MKKILAFGALTLLSAGAFALDLGDIKGTWQDSNWNANWTFGADGKITLSDSNTGKAIYTFDDSNVQNFKIAAGKSGVSVSFDCKDTERAYKFTKPLTLNSDLDMHIDPEWTSTDYDVKIKFQK